MSYIIVLYLNMSDLISHVLGK